MNGRSASGEHRTKHSCMRLLPLTAASHWVVGANVSARVWVRIWVATWNGSLVSAGTYAPAKLPWSHGAIVGGEKAGCVAFCVLASAIPCGTRA